MQDPTRPTQQKNFVDSFGWNVSFLFCHSPDLAPSGYHLLTSFKQHMVGKNLFTDEEVKGEMKKESK